MPEYAYDRRWDRGKRGKRRFDDDYEPTFAKRDRHRRSLPAADARDAVDGLPEGDRWSTWDQPAASERGPRPYPGWLVTELAATDTELGILKTGKEADVFLLRRLIAHLRGAEFLDRDAASAGRWFTARGLAGAQPAPEDLAALLREEARL